MKNQSFKPVKGARVFISNLGSAFRGRIGTITALGKSGKMYRVIFDKPIYGFAECMFFSNELAAT